MDVQRFEQSIAQLEKSGDLTVAQKSVIDQLKQYVVDIKPA
jgi:hypothetical protein